MKPVRVLLAEDYDDIADAIAELLKPSVELVATVSSGQSLIAAAERLQPDILVVDISLPDMSGIEAVDIIRQTGNAARAVFLTIHSDSDFIRAAFAAGALGYVIKSQMLTDLTRAIYDALEGRVFVSAPSAKAHSKA